MIYGTHNSATGGKLIWWLKPIGGVINITSKCQNKTIIEQLKDGVRLFNLQVAYVNNKWRFTHGLAIYKEDVINIINIMKSYATVDNPIYFQLYLDKCFWCKQNKIAFYKFVEYIKNNHLTSSLKMFKPWIEGTNEYIDVTNVITNINNEEHYWTLSWAKQQNKFIDKLPFPKYHAKRYNTIYKRDCKSKYLMLDFYNI